MGVAVQGLDRIRRECDHEALGLGTQPRCRAVHRVAVRGEDPVQVVERAAERQFTGVVAQGRVYARERFRDFGGCVLHVRIVRGVVPEGDRQAVGEMWAWLGIRRG